MSDSDKLIKEIEEADMLRSTIVLQEAWESDDNISEEEMCTQLDALISVFERKTSYANFVSETNINNKSYLQ